MLSASVYRVSGSDAAFVRQADIDSVRHPEMIMELARRQGGRVSTGDVAALLRLSRKQAYRRLLKLVGDGKLAPRGSGGGTYYEVV